MKNNFKKQPSKSKCKDPEPVAYDTLYYDFETVDEYQSESEASELESEVSDKNDQENIYKEEEEMNNKYSFLIPSKEKKKLEKVHHSKTELKEEEYI